MQQEKLYPGWVQAVGMLLTVLPMLCVPGAALVQLLTTWRRRKQDVQQGTALKLQDDGGAC